MDFKKNFLIVHTAFPGDIILSIPLLRALKKLFPSSKITMVTTPSGKSILDNVNEINEFVIYDKKNRDRGLFGFLRTLKKIKRLHEEYIFDVAIIPHRFIRSALFCFLTGIKTRIGFTEPGNFITTLFYTDKVKRDKSIHEIERILSLMSPIISETIDPPKFDIPYSSSSVDKINSLLLPNNNLKDYVVIAPCSNWKTKAWPLEYYAKLASTIIDEGFYVAIVASGSQEDVEICKKITKECSNGKILNLAGKTSFQDLSYLCSKSKLMISNDSAPMHVGAAHDIPLIAIFGSTTKDLGFFPYSKTSIVFEENLECRPCGLHGKNKCPLGHFKCMRDITPDKIISHIKKNLF